MFFLHTIYLYIKRTKIAIALLQEETEYFAQVKFKVTNIYRRNLDIPLNCQEQQEFLAFFTSSTYQTYNEKTNLLADTKASTHVMEQIQPVQHCYESVP